nr:calcium-binding protein [Cryptococcus depauperatus CBS 7855]
MPQYMSAPTPYGSVSAEARRRYEERYAKKRAEEAAKVQAEAQAQQPPPPAQQQHAPSPVVNQGPLRPQAGQGYGGPPPHQNYRPPQQQQYHAVPPQQPQYHPPSQQQHVYQNAPPQQHHAEWSRPPPDQAMSSGEHQGGQNVQRTSLVSPPPVEDPELLQMFQQFDSSRTGQLCAFDLQKLLAKDATMEAREDCVKMVPIFDTDRSGNINFMEFEGLYRYIQDWHGIFRRFDHDRSGLIDTKELHAALLGFGFSLPPVLVDKLEKRFTPPPVPGQAKRQGISFDRFLMACVTVKHFTEAFRRLDPRNTGRITVGYHEFASLMDVVLDAPS